MDVFSDLSVTDRASKSLRLAESFAALQGVNYIGSEHLLLALAQSESGVSAAVLYDCGITSEMIAEAINRRLNK
jgi:ATP-dependent Clp protease ATP-binding subunit ClpC